MNGWTFTVGPGGFVTPEQMEEQMRQREETIRRMKDEKMCVLCKNTYLINDKLTMCSYSNKCVDDDNGQQCEHWEPLEI